MIATGTLRMIYRYVVTFCEVGWLAQLICKVRVIKKLMQPVREVFVLTSIYHYVHKFTRC
jgi:hypothetical protein